MLIHLYRWLYQAAVSDRPGVNKVSDYTVILDTKGKNETISVADDAKFFYVTRTATLSPTLTALSPRTATTRSTLLWMSTWSVPGDREVDDKKPLSPALITASPSIWMILPM